jgi:hypothetical protein
MIQQSKICQQPEELSQETVVGSKGQEAKIFLSKNN